LSEEDAEKERGGLGKTAL